MSIIYNGTTIQKLVYNGTEIKEAYYGTTKVYSGIDPTTIDYYVNMNPISESNWILFIQNELPRKIIESGRQNEFITKRVTLNNSNEMSYSQWQIADFNHDSSGNTVDLAHIGFVVDTQFGRSQYWTDSTVRSWLNDTYFSGFISTIRNIMKTMTVVTDGKGITYDKVKIPSGTEAGFGGDDIADGEGTKYPIAIFQYGDSTDYWLRSRNTRNLSYVWIVIYGDFIGECRYDRNAGVLPFIRF